MDMTGLAAELDRVGHAYLLTAQPDGTARVVIVRVEVDDEGVLARDVGVRGLRAVAERGAATLLVPPADVGGYAVISDGAATVEGADVRLVPRRSVLHRPAFLAPEGAGKADGCGHDCRPL